MIIVFISDTHMLHPDLKVPPGDVLIHAGDATMNGKESELYKFSKWFTALPHKHKIYVAGNHDWIFEKSEEKAIGILGESVIYLKDSEVTIGGLRIWGSPWQPWFYDWAFNLLRGDQIRKKWDLIPEGIDIVITHGPPYGYGDTARGGRLVGCKDLLETLDRVKPQVHISGHIHEGYGSSQHGPTHCINASVCDFRYRLRNEPIIVDLEPDDRYS